jgi:predicted membrane metal-binding protein
MVSSLQRAFNVAIVTFGVLLLAVLVWLVWNLLVGLLHGPQLSFAEVALIMAIISVGAWDVVVFQRRAAPAP